MKLKGFPVIAVIILVAAIAYFVWGLIRADFGDTSAGGRITPADYVSRYSEPDAAHLLVDVRTPEEYAEGHIANSVNIPLQELSSRLSEIPKDTPVVLYCRSGNRSNQAFNLLANEGYADLYDMGGIIDWQAQGYPISSG